MTEEDKIAAPAAVTASVPSALVHTETKSYGGHKVEFHVIERQGTDVLELIAYDCDDCAEYDRSFYSKSAVVTEIEAAAQTLLAARLEEIKDVRAALPAESDFAEQDRLLLADLRNKVAGEYLLARVSVDFKSDTSNGGIKFTQFEGDVTSTGAPLDVVLPPPEGQSEFSIIRKPKEGLRAEISSTASAKSTKSSKERRRRHTIKDVMANHAMEVIGVILGMPSKDGAEDGTTSAKSKSSRQRRHTAEADPSKRRSSKAGVRRSSKDGGRPPSGSTKYDLDAVAANSVRRRSNPRPASVKKNMIANTKEAVSSAVEGVKALLVSPKVAPSDENQFFPQESSPPVADAAVVADADVVAGGSVQPPINSSDSLLSPKENLTEATPVETSTPSA